MENTIQMGLLLDHYSFVLTPRQKRLLELHYLEDYSLFEIAELEGVTRQAVQDAITRGGTALKRAEGQLGLLAFLQRLQLLAARVPPAKDPALTALLEEIRHGL